MKKIAIILSGCGFLDGAEITESVSLNIALSKLGAECDFFAPDINIEPTAHSNTKQLPENTKRNTLEESARITRGNIIELSKLVENKYDGLAIPGGYGVAKNLCSWAEAGAACKVNPLISKIINDFHFSSKPILALCIAPALIAKVLGESTSATITIGNDKETALEIEKTGALHEDCSVTDFVTDRENKIVSSPAYMCEAKPHEVFHGISNATKEFYEMC